ncbi:MAG: DUF459 domain-containing protein [Helicobacter sp.]|nr:DUF459 domain-containing protein [Helicobacter sp.]
MYFKSFLISLIFAGIVLLALFNKSIIAYIEQTYDVNISLPDRIYSALEYISFPRDKLSFISKKLQSVSLKDKTQKAEIERIISENEQIDLNEYLTPEDTKENEGQNEDAGQFEIQQTPKKILIKGDVIYVKKGAKFALIGDSMMQGLSLGLSPRLTKLGFDVVDLARQSTGLTYQKFFNWIDAFKEALESDRSIDGAIIMLGANDPYNFPNAYFASQKWDKIYKERIDQMLKIASENNVSVMWFEVPNVRNKELDLKIRHLNALYQDELHNFKSNVFENVIYLETSKIISPNGYSPDLLERGRTRRVRAKDGIHFTKYGAQVISNILLDRMSILDDDAEFDTQPSEIFIDLPDGDSLDDAPFANLSDPTDSATDNR